MKNLLSDNGNRNAAKYGPPVCTELPDAVLLWGAGHTAAAAGVRHAESYRPPNWGPAYGSGVE